jgi:hypothetical protein
MITEIQKHSRETTNSMQLSETHNVRQFSKLCLSHNLTMSTKVVNTTVQYISQLHRKYGTLHCQPHVIVQLQFLMLHLQITDGWCLQYSL